MKILISLILVCLLFLPVVLAEDLNYSFPVTIDWIGNNQYYVRSEAGDFLFDGTNQTDVVVNLSMIRHYNCTYTQYNASAYMDDINDSLQILLYGYNFSKQYSDEKAAHERVIISLEDCEATSKDMGLNLENCSQKKIDCDNTLSATSSQFLACNKDLVNCTTDLAITEKTSGDKVTALGVLVGAGIVVVIWWFNNNKSKFLRSPSEMSQMGQDSGPRI